jgi:type II secretory pathway component PulJ
VSKLDQAGFTVLELIIAASMMSIIGLIVLNFFTENIINYHRSESQITLQSNTRQAIDTMSKTIRSAQTLEETNSITDANQPGGWETDADTLVLATPSLDSGQNPIFADVSHNTVYTDNVIFYVSESVIFRRILANPNATGNAAITTCPPASSSPSCPPDNKVVEDIATLSMSYDNPLPEQAQSVQLTITRIRNFFGKTFTSTVTGNVTLRNK